MTDAAIFSNGKMEFPHQTANIPSMKLPRTRVAVIDVVALSRQMMEHMPRLSAWAEGTFPPSPCLSGPHLLRAEYLCDGAFPAGARHPRQRMVQPEHE